MAPSSLLVLGAAGAALLWGVMLVNGTLDAVSLVVARAAFPDGRPLRTAYTGLAPVDARLATVVAFFDLLASARSPAAPCWLFFDLCAALAAVNTWVLVESRRRGVRSFFLRHIVVFVFLWTVAGAAMVTPIYLYFLARSGYTARDPTVPLNEARGFPPTAVANALFPLLLFVPAWRGWAPESHQGSIALYLATPLLMIVVVVCSRPGTSLTTLETSKNKAAPDEDAPWVVASFAATGVIAAVVHMYVVAAALLTPAGSGSDLSLGRLFVPAPSRVLAAPRGSWAALVEGAHLFTQFDCIVLAAATVVFTDYLLEKSSRTRSRTSELAWNVAATTVLGPAAAGSFALAVRECRLRESVRVKQA